MHIEDLIPDSIVLEGEIDPKAELIKVLGEMRINKIVETQIVKNQLAAVAEQYNLATEMSEVIGLLTKLQIETI